MSLTENNPMTVNELKQFRELCKAMQEHMTASVVILSDKTKLPIAFIERYIPLADKCNLTLAGLHQHTFNAFTKCAWEARDVK